MYKTLKKAVLVILPNSLLYRLEPAFRSLVSLFYMGNKVYCPLCETSFCCFVDLGNEAADKLCPKCGSIQRKRLLWLYLANEIGLGPKPLSILHFSPHRYLAKRIRNTASTKYLTSDYTNQRSDRQYDIHSINEPDNTFDLIICYHVLEHIQDDKKAMIELKRILKPEGVALLQVPFREGETIEDTTVTDPQQRLEKFGQEDHMRWYGHDDFCNRLTEAGFCVESVQYAQQLDADRMVLNVHERIIKCTK